MVDEANNPKDKNYVKVLEDFIDGIESNTQARHKLEVAFIL